MEMFNMAKILKCDDCGSIIQVLAEDDGDACDTHMFEFPAQTEGEKSLNINLLLKLMEIK